MSEKTLVIVSGGSRGLGEHLVRALLADGYPVATFSRGKTPFIDSCMAGHPDRFYWEECDITDAPRLDRFVAECTRRFGPVGTLINNAAFATDGLFLFTKRNDMHKALAVNVEAVMNLTQTCLSGMVRARKGIILNVSSVSAVRGIKGVAAYGATKAAVDGFTRGLAREVGSQGIRVNSVALGYFESAMSTALLDSDQVKKIVERTPLKRVGHIEEMVGVIRFLMSPAAGFITGQTLLVDGGLTC
ncbi:SDR family NAD(P)-dependent oxidoreductase [Cystobacter fuscus]|uniref:SDR family NAD(P)-dependent oxidoreductase n=1 Tax=Cystobacter fuscus TaxID=43 RepID=UPI002B2B183A|nr:SDR family oxidoreductase [Cystobacter fuscus]